MKAHLKRIAMPRTWPLERKKYKFVVKGKSPHKLEFSLPLLIVLRDCIKAVHTAAEAKKVLNEKLIVLNNKVVIDPKLRAGLFDRIYIKKLEKYYTMHLKGKKLAVVEIKKEKAETKPCKIIGKTTLKGNRMQINCHDGRNFIVSEKFSVGDTIILDLKTNKIIKHLPISKGSFVLIYKGKHQGKLGKIEEIDEVKKKVTVNVENKKITLPKENVFVIEENEYEQ